jgi:hypothetical protein
MMMMTTTRYQSSEAQASEHGELTVVSEAPHLTTFSASTPPKTVPIIKNPSATEQRSPGKLLAALNDLTKTDVYA